MGAPQVLLRLTGTSVNGEIADVALRPKHDQLVEKAAAFLAKTLMHDLAACAHVHEVMFAIQKSLKERCEVEVLRTPGT